MPNVITVLSLLLILKTSNVFQVFALSTLKMHLFSGFDLFVFPLFLN